MWMVLWIGHDMYQGPGGADGMGKQAVRVRRGPGSRSARSPSSSMSHTCNTHAGTVYLLHDWALHRARSHLVVREQGRAGEKAWSPAERSGVFTPERFAPAPTSVLDYTRSCKQVIVQDIVHRAEGKEVGEVGVVGEVAGRARGWISWDGHVGA